MAETDDHRDLMLELIETVKLLHAAEQNYYVSGNLLVFYEEGNKLHHLSPDFFVVRGIPKHNRRHFLIWREGKGPEAIIELTSKSTRAEDVEHKFDLYEKVLKVQEYFLFDPHGEYLDPPLIGYRLVRGYYVRIQPIKGRLPSKVLGLHLERVGNTLRLYDPTTGKWVPTPTELREQAEAARKQEEVARKHEKAARKRAETAYEQEQAARKQAEAEIDRLRRELEELRRKTANGARRTSNGGRS